MDSRHVREKTLTVRDEAFGQDPGAVIQTKIHEAFIFHLIFLPKTPELGIGSHQGVFVLDVWNLKEQARSLTGVLAVLVFFPGNDDDNESDWYST